MKLTRTFWHWISAVALIGAPFARAAQVAAPANGDIFLGVRSGGGSGGATSLLINVGSYSNFHAGAAGSTQSLGNIGAHLSETFGSNWASRSDVTWGFFGARNLPSPVVYSSRPQTPAGRPASSYPAQDLSQRVATKNQIVSVVDAYAQLEALPGSPNAARQTNALNSGSYNFQVGSAGTTDFGSLSQWTTIEGNFSNGASGTALDFFRYGATGSVPETEKLGTFEITEEGVLSFTRALPPGVPGFKLASATYAVDEDAGDVAVVLRRTNDVSGEASVILSTVNGSAISGTDYTAQISLTVEFAADEFEKTVSIPILDRAGITVDRSFIVVLGSPSAGTQLSSPSEASVTIRDSDSAVQFASATQEVRALDGLGQPNVVEVALTRSGNLSEAATVEVSITGGSLTSGTHFTFTSPMELSFAQGADAASVEIPLESIAASALPGTIVLSLSDPQGAELGAVTTTTVHVLPNSGHIAFASATQSVTAVNNDGSPRTISVALNRTNGSVGPASVNVAVTGGSLISGTHFTALANPTTVHFANGINTAGLDLQLLSIPSSVLNNGATIELSLSNPTNSATIGTVGVTVITVTGSAGALTFTAANYDVLEEVAVFNLPIARTGGTTGQVTVTVAANNGSATAGADFNLPANLVVSFPDGTALASLPISILNTVSNEPNETFTVTLNSPGGGAALGAITSAVVRILDADKAAPAVTLTAPAANAKIPQTAGAEVSVTGTATDNKAVEKIELQLNGAAFINVPFTVDAKGKASFSFPITALRGTNIINVRGVDARGNVSAIASRTFVFDDPFAALAGGYVGLIRASGVTAPSHSTNGLVSIDLKNTGSFSGKLTIDGLALSFTGFIGANGVARFGATGADKVRVERPNKPAYEVAFRLDLTANAPRNKITGTVTQYQRATVTATASLDADRRGFNGKSPATTVPADYLANKGAYTVVFPAQAPQEGFTQADYPQGDGAGTVTVKADGSVNFAGTLADGTKLTASAALWKDLTLPLYAELYSKNGSLSGYVAFDKDQADSDLKAEDLLWFRPFQNVQHYPYGWPEGLTTVLLGARYSVPTNASALPGVGGVDASAGNAVLEFNGGLLTGGVTRSVNIDSKDKATNAPSADKSFSLSISQANGLISGKFTHSDGTQPSFSGVIYQKGPGKGGYGWFLSTSPKVRDGSGEAGAVTLTPR
jgi:hypothetical protein